MPRPQALVAFAFTSVAFKPKEAGSRGERERESSSQLSAGSPRNKEATYFSSDRRSSALRALKGASSILSLST